MPLFRRLRQLCSHLRQGGWPWFYTTLRERCWPDRPNLTSALLKALHQQTGLEIGGPSRVFAAHKTLPVYPQVQHLDNVNFTAQTAWEAGLKDGGDFMFDPAKPPGRQFLREATALVGLSDAAYDFVISSHCLEHVANPLAALLEWRRVTRDGGHLLLLLPDPRYTFDHHRPTTTLAHLREDYGRKTGENDLTHLSEILAHHDLTRDPLAGTAADFATRSDRNAENRCLHHHVFSLDLMRTMLAETGWEILALEAVRPIHLIAWAKKSSPLCVPPAGDTTESR